MTKPTRILLVDDHALMRDGIRAALEREPDLVVVAEAAASASAVEEFSRHNPDLTVMDLRLPDVSGIQTIERLLKIDPRARVLVLSTSDGDHEIRSAMEAGAYGYLLKTSPRAELLIAIRTIHRGERYVSKSVEALLREEPSTSNLTAREIEVLRLIAKGLSDKEIANVLQLSIFTVNTHVRAVLRKLGVQDRVQAAVSALQRGFAEFS